MTGSFQTIHMPWPWSHQLNFSTPSFLPSFAIPTSLPWAFEAFSMSLLWPFMTFYDLLWPLHNQCTMWLALTSVMVVEKFCKWSLLWAENSLDIIIFMCIARRQNVWGFVNCTLIQGLRLQNIMLQVANKLLSRHVSTMANPKVCQLASTVLGQLCSSALRHATQW
jgi:hypothetical protein